VAGVTGDLSAPVRLDPAHDTSGFTCGNDALDDWLKATALKAEGRSARTYVVREGEAVVGYYSLATGSVARSGAPGNIRRNMPEPVPVVIVARLAVASRSQGRGIGSALLRDGLRRALQVSEVVGCRAVLIHAIDQSAVDFYARHGFGEFPGGSRTLFLSLETLRQSL
jgi:GNAT superfamily N-acetyltransferase